MDIPVFPKESEKRKSKCRGQEGGGKIKLRAFFFWILTPKRCSQILAVSYLHTESFNLLMTIMGSIIHNSLTISDILYSVFNNSKRFMKRFIVCCFLFLCLLLMVAYFGGV